MPAPISCFAFSHRQLSIPSTSTNFIQGHLDVGTDDGDVSGERSDRSEEVTEEYEDAVQLDKEANQGPAEEDEKDAG